MLAAAGSAWIGWRAARSVEVGKPVSPAK